MRAWTATALLAGSWLLGMDYFQPADYLAWVGFLLAAVALLTDVPLQLPERPVKIAVLVLLLPAVWLVPWPLKAIPGLLAAGVILCITPIPRQWPRAAGHGAIVAAVILLAQSLVLWAYQLVTARGHELPWPLTECFGAAVRLMGIDVAVDGATVAVRSVSSAERFATTWELLLDPVSVCFVVGGIVLLRFVSLKQPRGTQRRRAWLNNSAVLLVTALLWAPLRAGLLVALVLHRSLRADAVTAPNVGEILVNSWLHILLLGGLTLLIARLVPLGNENAVKGPGGAPDHVDKFSFRSRRWRQIAGPILAGSGIATLAALYWWVPIGQPKSRVLVVERHSTWEPTTEPYGTMVYGEAGSYNYAVAYAFCGQFYEMSRLLESDPINDDRLADCDVLIIKTPTARYSQEEVMTVVRYVEQGGSLLLVGDHTNVFNMNTYLNDISRHFGFTFRNDLLFRVGTPYRQTYRPAMVRHPIVQHLPPMNFAVSCSIDPGRSLGDMVIRSTGLWNLPPAYHESNYHPQAEYRPNMQYGAWCQLWSTSHGAGRVLAFADSTLFSNFCVFQPGKAELLIGMLQWLNHGSTLDRRGTRLGLYVVGTVAGMLLLLLGVWFSRDAEGTWLLPLATGLAAWAGVSSTVAAAQRHALPLPQNARPIPHVVIDRTISSVPLFTGAFADEKEGNGYGMLEQWIPRVGNFISRRTGPNTFMGDGLVIICPNRSVSVEYRERLMQYVQAGGRVLIVDSMEIEDSTSNSVLWLFGMASSHDVQQQPEATLRLATGGPEIPLQTSCTIAGGQTLAWWGDTPVAAQVAYGQGTVTAIGFGSLFNDANMGFHWLPEPEDEVLARYEVLYTLLRASLPHEPLPRRLGSFP